MFTVLRQLIDKTIDIHRVLKVDSQDNAILTVERQDHVLIGWIVDKLDNQNNILNIAYPWAHLSFFLIL